MEDIKQFFQIAGGTLGVFCAIAFCFGYIPAIPVVLFMVSLGVLFVFDFIEDTKEWNEKGRKKAAKRGLISL